VVLSSCKLNQLAQPIAFLDSQIRAEWNQSALLEFEPARSADCQLYIGAGYSLKRYAFSSHFGEHMTESLEPSFLFPITISYARPQRFGEMRTFLNVEYEFDGQNLIKNCSLLHEILHNKNIDKESFFTLYAQEVLFYQNINVILKKQAAVEKKFFLSTKD
jgi:hypothetical protein